MKNGASHVVEVFDRSVQIFLVLLARFKVYLKTQLEHFFKDILLNVLEISTRYGRLIRAESDRKEFPVPEGAEACVVCISRFPTR